MHDAYTKPQSRDVTAGRVHALNTHGSIVYLTDEEHLLLCGLQILAGLVFGTAIIVDLLRRRDRR
jgi:hypothetical protein